MKEYITWCPLCTKEMLYTLKDNESYAKCKFCGHHLVIRECLNEEEDNECKE